MEENLKCMEVGQRVAIALWGTCRSAVLGKINMASHPYLTGLPGRGFPGFPGTKGEKGNIC